MLGEVGVGALSRHEGLDPEAEDGDCFCEGVGLCAVEVSASFFNEKKKEGVLLMVAGEGAVDGCMRGCC